MTIALDGAGALLDRAGGRPAPPLITIDGPRITAFAEHPAEIPPGADVIDCGGGTVVPAFLDAHVHVQFTEARLVAAGGVLGVRDLGSPWGARQSWDVQRVPMVSSGAVICALGGYPADSWGGDGTALEVRDVLHAQAAVAELAAAGASVIKVALEDSGGRAVLAEPILVALVAAAARQRLDVAAHCGGPGTVRLALTCGVRELVHLPLHNPSPDLMADVARAGVRMVPTLAIRRGYPGLEPLAAAQAVRAYLDAGGVIAYGTDLGNAGTQAGIMIEEVAALRSAGMSLEEIIDAATDGAADLLRLPAGRLIEPGHPADLLVLDGDPREDLRAFTRLIAVIGGGLPVPLGT